MSKAYDDSRYLARTLAVTLLDLEPAQRTEILRYLQEELERLTHALNEDVSRSDQGEAETEPSLADDDDGHTSDALRKQIPHRRIS